MTIGAYVDNSINNLWDSLNIKETAKELERLIKNSEGLEKEYYQTLYKQLSHIKRVYNVAKKYGVEVINAVLTANTIYLTHQWDNSINNYMAIFLKLEFKDMYFLSGYGFFDLDNKVFTSKYYYIVDTVLSSVVNKDTDLIGMDIFKLNTILEDKLNEIKHSMRAPIIPMCWVGYVSYTSSIYDEEQERINKKMREQELQELRIKRGGVL